MVSQTKCITQIGQEKSKVSCSADLDENEATVDRRGDLVSRIRSGRRSARAKGILDLTPEPRASGALRMAEIMKMIDGSMVETIRQVSVEILEESVMTGRA